MSSVLKKEKKTKEKQYDGFLKVRIETLRNFMRESDILYYIVPQSDEHLTEFLSPEDKRLEYISGFTGSAGTGLVGLNTAYLFTDPRYYKQAEKELDSSVWELKKFEGDKMNMFINELSKKVGFDPKLMAASNVDSLWTSIFENLIDKVKLIELDTSTSITIDKKSYSKGDTKDEKKEERKLTKIGSIIVLPDSLTGETYKSKRSRLMTVLAGKTIILTKLDEIAWLTNLRGSDIEYCQLFKAFMIIHPDTTYIYIDKSKIGISVASYLASNNIIVRPYLDFYNDLRFTIKKKIVYDAESVNYLVYQKIPKETGIFKNEEKMTDNTLTNPVQMMKAVKNEIEIDGFKRSHLLDGIAKCKFLSWASGSSENPSPILSGKITEYDLVERLESYRKLSGDYLEPSFPTISASGKNSAIIHYIPKSQSECSIVVDNIYLCDSGGQYVFGTTDLTRTVHFGEPTKEQIKMFTVVLKGHISLAMVKFPKGTTGAMLDSLARQYLWTLGTNYDHGTGHGVGHRLNVHEFPPYIDGGSSDTMSELKPGMIMSNEPGYYKPDHYGIRIESIMLVVESEEEGFLEFEQLTLVPMDRKLIDISQFDKAQKDWLNSYHQKCWDLLSPNFIESNDIQTLGWLEHNCFPF